MMGTKEFDEMVSFGMGLGQAIAQALEDGKVNFSDVFKVLPALMSASDAFEGVENIPAELADLDDAEYANLVAKFKKEFDLDDDEVEAKVELGYQIALKVAQLVASFKKG